MKQLTHYVVCQYCGHGAHRNDAIKDGWLVSPRRSDPNIEVVRCPRHISEWSLRQSVAGRTKEMRRKMREGQDWQPPPYLPGVEPIPLRYDPLDRQDLRRL